jgi:hypothetical protein
MTPPPLQIAGGGLQYTGTLANTSMSGLGTCKLGDTLTLAPVGSLSDPQARLVTHLVNCVWGQKGHLWLEQSLNLGGTFHLLNSGGQGSLALDSKIFYQPVRELRISLSFMFNGTLDWKSGYNGKVAFTGQVHALDSKATMINLGFHFY